VGTNGLSVRGWTTHLGTADVRAGFHDLHLRSGVTGADHWRQLVEPLEGRRDQRQTGELIEPGRVYPITIRPFPTANVFKKGHRIRLDVSSSMFPRFDPNPNSGESLGKDRRVIKADNTVHHSTAYPSHLKLSIVSR